MDSLELESQFPRELMNVGDMMRKGAYSEALQASQELLATCEGVLGVASPQSLSCALTVGELLIRNRKFDEARASFEKTRDAASSLEKPDATTATYALNGLGRCELAAGNNEEALAIWDATLGVIVHSAADLKTETISEIFQDLIEGFSRLNATDSLKSLHTEVAALIERMDGENFFVFISKALEAARWLAAHGDLASATRIASRMVTEHEQRGIGDLESYSSMKEILGRAAMKEGSAREAIRHFTDAMGVRNKLFGNGGFETGGVKARLSEALLEERRVDEARQRADEALGILRTATTIETPEEALASEVLGEIELSEGKLEDARSHLLRSFQLFERLEPQNLEMIAKLLHNLGVISLADGNYEQAATYLERAVHVRKDDLRRDDLDLAQSLMAWGKAYESLGNQEKARAAYRDSLSIQERFLRQDDPGLLACRTLIQELDGPRASEPEEAHVEPAAVAAAVPPPLPKRTAPAPASSHGGLAPAEREKVEGFVHSAIAALKNDDVTSAMRILRSALGILKNVHPSKLPGAEDFDQEES